MFHKFPSLIFLISKSKLVTFWKISLLKILNFFWLIFFSFFIFYQIVLWLTFDWYQSVSIIDSQNKNKGEKLSLKIYFLTTRWLKIVWLLLCWPVVLSVQTPRINHIYGWSAKELYIWNIFVQVKWVIWKLTDF